MEAILLKNQLKYLRISLNGQGTDAQNNVVCANAALAIATVNTNIA